MGMDLGFKYIKSCGGLETEEHYPYHAEDRSCKFSKKHIAASLTGFVDVTSGDEELSNKPLPPMPATVLSRATAAACTMKDHAALPNWTTEYWLSDTVLRTAKTTGSLRTPGLPAGEKRVTSR